MFLTSFISIILFWNGDVHSIENNLKFVTTPERILTMSTFGNLGEPTSFCYELSDSQSVNIDCGHGGTIRSIIAYYGSPTGSCSCPIAQLPSASGCPGTTGRDASGNEVCKADASGTINACFPSYLQHQFPYYQQSCCAYEKDPRTGSPSLDALNIVPDYGCNSYTAQYIAEGVCLGEKSCSLSADPTVAYTWATATAPPSYVCESPMYAGQCTSSVEYAGSFASCVASEERTLKIQVT